MSVRRGLASALAAALVLGAAACGGSASRAQVVTAGQVDARDVLLPPGWKTVHDGAARAATSGAGRATASGGASGGDAAPAETIPLAKESGQSAFLSAAQKFQQCLTNNGVKFIGAPDAANPSAPSNDPEYRKALGVCAAQSGIVQAMKDAQEQQAAQTPEEIQKANEGYLAWRECMVGRGWTIPKPTPDAQGRLFSIAGGGGGGGQQMTAPPGKDLLTSSDTSECATEAQKKNGAKS